MAKNLGIQGVHMDSDAKETINLIIDDNINDRTIIPLILDCRKLILEFKRFKIQHVFHEANRVTGALTKESIKMNGQFITTIKLPSAVLYLLLFVEFGKTQCRVVPNITI